MSEETIELQNPKVKASSLTRTLATASTRLLDLPTRYGMHFLLAARLAIGDLGAFYIVFSVMTLASGFGRIGLDRAMTREIAAALGRDLPNTARRVIWRGFFLSTVNSTIITLACIFLSKPIAIHILHKPELALPLAIGSISILPQNVANAAAGALAGLGRVATSQMIHQWLWPGIFCAGALLMPLSVNQSLWLIDGSMFVIAILGILLLLPILPKRHAEVGEVELPSLSRLGAQLFSAELLQLAMASLPPFVLGVVATTVDVGQYALAWRIVLMLNLLVSAMAAVAMPDFARAEAQGDMVTLRRVAAQTVGITVALAVIPSILLAINPVFILGHFGAGYDTAAPALRVLLIGQFALILCAAVPEMLGMTGRAKVLLKLNVVSAVVLMVGLAVLSKPYKDVGAAAATAMSMLINAFGASWAAKRELGLFPLWNFVEDLRVQTRRFFQPATPSDTPSETDIQEMDNS